MDIFICQDCQEEIKSYSNRSNTGCKKKYCIDCLRKRANKRRLTQYYKDKAARKKGEKN